MFPYWPERAKVTELGDPAVPEAVISTKLGEGDEPSPEDLARFGHDTLTCSKCRTPSSDELESCPSCGAALRPDVASQKKAAVVVWGYFGLWVLGLG